MDKTERLHQTLRDVHAERERQELLKMEGRFTYTCADYELSSVDCLAILAREFGEVARATSVRGDQRPELLSGQSRAQLRDELIQTAAVAVAWAERLTDR